MSRWLPWTLIGLFASLPLAAFDLQSDAPIAVSADNARLDDAKGVATYTGDVVVTQNQTQLAADRVVLYRDAEGLKRIEAYGEPARYRQPATAEQAETRARARTIIYAARDSEITFKEQAVIEQGANLFRGEHILYDTAERVVTAEGGQTGDGSPGRVEMIIQPNAPSGTGNQP
ncbi:MAG: lipopolysaccharide transport periplasmic protein LptA [Marinobacter sp.]|uniref:lipopolysaccharide transport periplasmic protein LptA n=1 Tax=Marinobacter sp. TaxID=50741 RepID=UPI00299E7307|nr:lipopolysaccharide transport periplasmic protein LptA [Marinobacter sp.]MDX1633860.1 lipopolysaccharide transport periplasmic protein LptA [Marinobacter sp.]